MATLRKRMDPRVPRRARPREEQRIDAFLKNVQDALMPQHAAQIVAINTENGEYAVGATFHEACEGFRARWPDVRLPSRWWTWPADSPWIMTPKTVSLSRKPTKRRK